MNRAVAIGIFDGVHAGHQELLKLGKLFGKVVALTFYPHPTSVFAPERTPSQLVSLEDRVALLKHHGADEVVVIEFTKEFAALSPDQFIEEVLVEQLQATHIVVGENFTFGHKAAGNVEYLRNHKQGFDVTAIKLEENRGVPVSSTRIRNLVMDGDVERAADLLTRPHYVCGPVVHGEKRGREIGYPTANIGLASYATIPADGVYAGWLTVGGVRWPAAISIGTNPTFPGIRGRQVEAYALDETDLDLYDQEAKLEILYRLRDTLKFESLDELLVQMASDCNQTRVLLNS
ncbi:MAG: bifunctional riboflavin kinase/FAD synthetase, partial [Actinomycetes bacterium]